MLNQQVFVRGTGCGVVLEEMCSMILVEFDQGLAWVDLRVERVEVVS